MSARWQQVKEILNSVLERPPDERRDFLDRVCAEDNSLRREVEILLLSAENIGSFLEQAAIGKVAEMFVSGEKQFLIGKRLNHYKILSHLGAGGMGEVYLAEDEKLRRRVALKILPDEFCLDNQSVARFLREAQAASVLNHPNICTIYEINDECDPPFIAMEYVEGETLAEKIKSRKIDLKETLGLALQISDALAEAHARGIVHRDIKPQNIIVNHRGQAKILDFGLAKRIAAESEEETQRLLSRSGMVMGTAAYMSPEQARGQKVDARTDLWSFGVVLYEMLAGERPFEGETAADVMASILTTEPSFERLPAPVRGVVAKTLRRERGERYQTAKELQAELRAAAAAAAEASGGRKFSRRSALAAVLILALAAAAAGGWLYWQNRNLDRARENARRVEELAKAGKYFEAYDLALQVNERLPGEPTVAKWMPTVADTLTVKTEPAGAKVFLRRFQPDAAAAAAGNFPVRELVGETPLEKLPIARGGYLLYVEREGFAPFARSVSGMPERILGATFHPPPIRLEIRLKPAAEIPERMIFVPGGKYRLVSWRKPTSDTAELDDFLIDKYEVTNREFKEFIVAGGYLKRQFWKQPFVAGGKEIPFEEAMRQLKDRTGLPAPRSWSNQTFPAGKDDHPVTDITWYEAAAYAEFRGKSLPTVYQWEKTARDGAHAFGNGEMMPWGLVQDDGDLLHRANFGSAGTAPVDSFEFGMSPFGAYHMADNVAEWCRNELTEGFTTAGASWNELSYVFGSIAAFPGFHSSDKLGFRCVKNLGGGQQGGGRIDTTREIPVYRPSSEAQFQKWLVHYDYDKTPLEAQIVETIETTDWRREKITYAGAGDERAIAYLFLPRNYRRPLQVIQYVPAGDVWGGYSSVPQHVETVMTPYIKSGRAVFAVVLKGFAEREHPPNYKSPPASSIKFRELTVGRATDLRRGIDYLETREDIDKNRIVYWGLSSGAHRGLVFAAVEARYRAMVMIGGGLWQEWDDWIAEANQANFAPHIKIPKLMLNGRYDEQFSWKTEAEPLYKLLREPKRLEMYDGGHSPPHEIAVPIVSRWLDETIGAVQRE